MPIFNGRIRFLDEDVVGMLSFFGREKNYRSFRLDLGKIRGNMKFWKMVMEKSEGKTRGKREGRFFNIISFLIIIFN